MLGEGDGIGDGCAKMLVEVVDFDLVGPEPGHDGGPAWVAERELIVGSVKADTLGGEAVDVRCLDDKIAVTTQRRSEIVDGDEEDIGLFGCGSESAGEKEEASDHVDVKFYNSYARMFRMTPPWTSVKDAPFFGISGSLSPGSVMTTW